MKFSNNEINEEATRLYSNLSRAGWSVENCKSIAPITLEINHLKKEQDAIILAHSYQTADIIYGVADFAGDSYGLSVTASKKKAKKIIFCSVYFMAETAKLLSPEKEVIVPNMAGCSLAESITAENIIELRKKYPKSAIVCYVNTYAAVKAECDICCTSSNAEKIVNKLPQKDIIFIPDEFMAKNLRTKKNIIAWKGRCIVHERFFPEQVQKIRKLYSDVKILAHTECSPSVIANVDFPGSTSSMLEYVKNSDSNNFMLVTECGLSDRVRVEFPNKNIVGSCNLCPYMKEIHLNDVLMCLKEPKPEQIIEIPEDTAERARKALDRMFELEKKILD